MVFFKFFMKIYFFLHLISQVFNAVYISKQPKAIFFKQPQLVYTYQHPQVLREIRPNYFRPIIGYPGFNEITHYLPHQQLSPLHLSTEQKNKDFFAFQHFNGNHDHVQLYPPTLEIPYHQPFTNHLDYSVSDVKPVEEHIEDDFKYDFRTKQHSYH